MTLLLNTATIVWIFYITIAGASCKSFFYFHFNDLHFWSLILDKIHFLHNNNVLVRWDFGIEVINVVNQDAYKQKT